MSYQCGLAHLLVAGILLSPGAAQAGGKAKPDTGSSAKKVVALTPVQNIQIEMPDQSLHDFGQDYEASLVTQLTQSGRYIVTDPQPLGADLKVESIPQGYSWAGSVTPSATIRIEVDALTFQTGSRGESMFYGFDERFRTPFNDGTGTLKNEFPLKTNSAAGGEASWFGDAFDDKGVAPFDSQSGLDLGDGFDINVLFAYLTVKYALYHSELHLKLRLDTPLGAATEFRLIQVAGNGFFFDVAGAYQNYSAAITAARGDAMQQAVKSALDGSVAAIDRALSSLPLMAKIDAVLPDGTVLLGTGPNSGIPSGILYQIVNTNPEVVVPEVVVEVSSSVASGSIGRVVSGDASQAVAGALLRQIPALPTVSASVPATLSATAPATVSTTMPAASSIKSMNQGETLSGVDNISLPSVNLPEAPTVSGMVSEISQLEAFLKSIAEAIFLPYRIYRYFTYDQTYHADADLDLPSSAYDFGGDSWTRQIGLDLVPEETQGEAGVVPVVAVIDSGVDYNHPVVHGALWLNSSPWLDPDGRQDRYGWDFVSEDSRPFDDGYHGTQIAGLVTTVAPAVKIMPIKIFNPYGITTSATVYAGFVYAVDHGAQIIVCGWSTGVNSQAIRMGVSYARDHGVVVVAAAGDQGINLAKWNDVYPSILSRSMDNQVTVTAVDSNDQLVSDGQRKSNFLSCLSPDRCSRRADSGC